MPFVIICPICLCEHRSSTSNMTNVYDSFVKQHGSLPANRSVSAAAAADARDHKRPTMFLFYPSRNVLFTSAYSPLSNAFVS